MKNHASKHNYLHLCKNISMLKYLLLISLLLPFALFSQSFDIDHAAEKRWHLRDVAEDSKTPRLAKDIYLGKDWELTENNSAKLLSIVERLPDMDPMEKGFYFIVIAKSFDRAEGAYSESLGYSGKSYIDNNMAEFLNYFCGEGKMPDVFLQKWAGIVSNEMEKVKVDQDPKIATKISKIYDAKCKDCRSEQKAVLKKFEDLLKTYIK